MYIMYFRPAIQSHRGIRPCKPLAQGKEVLTEQGPEGGGRREKGGGGGRGGGGGGGRKEGEKREGGHVTCILLKTAEETTLFREYAVLQKCGHRLRQPPLFWSLS